MSRPISELWECSTVEEFLDRLRRSNSYWWEGDRCPWIFRGQWDAEWELLPAAFRRGRRNKLRPLLNQLLPECIFSGDRWGMTRGRVQFMAEIEALHQFGRLAKDVRLSLPSVPPSARRYNPRQLTYREPSLHRESSIVDHFCPPLDIAPIAQHHGIPTRLLDFTTHPLWAAYFAVGRDWRPAQASKKIAVWAFKVDADEFGDRSRQILYIDHVISTGEAARFLEAQYGCFLFLKGAYGYYDEHALWPSLEAYLADMERWMKTCNEVSRAIAEKNFPLLRKITLPTEQADSLLEILEKEHMSMAHLMPNLENVARTVMRRWDRR